MSYFCEAELIRPLQNSSHGFTLHLESTYGTGLAILLVRHVSDLTAQEDMFICKPLSDRTSETIFETVNKYTKTKVVLELMFPHLSLFSVQCK